MEAGCCDFVKNYTRKYTKPEEEVAERSKKSESATKAKLLLPKKDKLS